MRKGQHFQYKVHKNGKRDNESRKADNLIREISQQNQHNKQKLTNTATNQGSKGVNTIQGKTQTFLMTDDSYDR